MSHATTSIPSAPSPRSILSRTAHRPWPLPAGPWVMRQNWHDLLFAHWRVRIEDVRRLVPPDLAIDTFEGSAWLGLVPFRMSGVRVRGLPPIPGAHAFPELNVRTYVKHADRPGVWFFSLDATSALAVLAARLTFHLPYFRARMICRSAGEDVQYESTRAHRRAPPAELEAQYGPTSAVEHATPGSIEHWLSERYCLYARTPRGRLLRGEIHHAPWPLQRAHARIERCTYPAAHGLAIANEPPHLLFARRQDVLVWPPRRVT